MGFQGRSCREAGRPFSLAGEVWNGMCRAVPSTACHDPLPYRRFPEDRFGAIRAGKRGITMSMDAIAAKMREKVEGSGFSKSVKFDCGADGVVVIEGATVSTTDAPADCTITLAKDDLESMIAGELDPTSAFMQGKLKVDGDMSVAMALSQVL
jgi:putative sterol carrier protein